MNKFKRISETELFELIVPFATPPGEDGPGEDGLYDDCPLCRDLRRAIEKGDVEPVNVDENED